LPPGIDTGIVEWAGAPTAPEPKTSWRNRKMAWTTPRVIEISVGMEINCYACAEI
jgi:coenzyme PQQ precursor peptide PqqA